MIASFVGLSRETVSRMISASKKKALLLILVREASYLMLKKSRNLFNCLRMK